MYLLRLLQINIATMAALGALLLGMGRRESALAMFVCFAALASIWLTDITGWFRLNRAAAAVATVIASALSLRELIRFGGNTQTLAVASLLVYLQVILLFQKKDTRIYWQLIMLSLLQVVIAAAFSQGAWFGLLLVVYMLVGLSALALLMLHGQIDSHRPADAPAKIERRPAKPAAARRWHLNRREATFDPATAGGTAGAAGGELFRRLGLLALGTFVLTLIMFVTVPRLGSAQWREPIVAPRHAVGFSDKVTLGELGRIIENPEEVMRVELTETDTGDLYEVPEGVYFRGVVLNHYENQQWSSAKAGQSSIPSIPAIALKGDAEDRPHDRVIQHITIEPLDRDEMFCVWPPVEIVADENVKIKGGRLLRPSWLRGRRVAFALQTTAFHQGCQRLLVPVEEMPEKGPDAKTLLKTPDLPELAALAEKWDTQGGTAGDDHHARALNLERRLRDSDRFSYSLQGQPRDPNIDPIEDFVTNNPRGHCEYFATALALMLRSRDIPSRVVLGYKCDEFNELGNFHQVRQLHAHAWVEAYIQSEQAWLRLDATPGGGLESEPGHVQQGINWLQYTWQNYVMEMDGHRQVEAVYKPLAAAISSAFGRLRDPEFWRAAWSKITAAFRLNGWSAILWWCGLAACLCGLGVVVFRSARRLKGPLGRLIAKITGKPAESFGSRRTRVDFQCRMEAMLAECGFVRKPGQTHHEFARESGRQLAELTGRSRLGELPSDIVSAFYRVRFGHLPLDSTRSQAVEQALSELAEGLQEIPNTE